jgi:hypothetical protein
MLSPQEGGSIDLSRDRYADQLASASTRSINRTRSVTMTTQRMYRQGDVLLVPVATIPAGTTPVALQIPGRHVLAFGEVTGHHHSIAVADAELTKTAETVYLQVMTETPLEHQEHAAIQVPAGNYRVVIQREYHPEAIRNVAD